MTLKRMNRFRPFLGDLATNAQLQYIDQLFIDCRFHTRAQLIDLLNERIIRRHPIKFCDEMTKVEASKAIVLLKEIKENGI